MELLVVEGAVEGWSGLRGKQAVNATTECLLSLRNSDLRTGVVGVAFGMVGVTVTVLTT
jgi:hypothetical protein